MIKHLFNVAHALVREHVSKAFNRSPRWPEARKKFLETHPICAACLDATRLQVHHVKPFHLRPELELDPQNFMTLCMGPNECHLKLGHGDSFQSYNPNVRENARDFRVATQEGRAVILATARASRAT